MFGVLVVAGSGVLAAEPEYDRLLAFVQPGKSAVDDHFQSTQLPTIRQVADRMDTGVHIRQPENGDAFDAVAAETPVMDWDQLGFSLQMDGNPAKN